MSITSKTTTRTTTTVAGLGLTVAAVLLTACGPNATGSDDPATAKTDPSPSPSYRGDPWEQRARDAYDAETRCRLEQKPPPGHVRRDPACPRVRPQTGEPVPGPGRSGARPGRGSTDRTLPSPYAEELAILGGVSQATYLAGHQVERLARAGHRG